jgi:hypothetical protein
VVGALGFAIAWTAEAAAATRSVPHGWLTHDALPHGLEFLIVDF